MTWSPAVAETLSFSSWTPAQTCTIDWTGFLHRSIQTSCCMDWQELVSNKTILITGAAGSIGSDLADLMMGGHSGKLVLLDRSAHNLSLLYRNYRQRNITLPKVEFIHADILEKEALEETFSNHSPDIVFHTAALKHVHQLESEPFGALETNLMGTLRLLQMVDCAQVEHFVNLSTDKAVNPTSVLGVSKRISELLLLSVDAAQSHRISLRLGNVLGTSGSVVPIFIHALQTHSPLLLTAPQASRFFITREEAVTFLVRSLEIPENSLLLAEMGCPQKIMDLANFLLREFALDGGGAICVTGLRDGEKLSEQLLYDYEHLEHTQVQRLFRIVNDNVLDRDRFAEDLGHLLELVVARKKCGLIQALSNIVPEFEPSQTLLHCIG
ncbi:MAG: polysaccharide biosynthesis protein [Candidatus Angelobacter sp.]